MFEWLAGFVMNPAMAVGAGAVASPIIIHILSKRRFRRVRWATMDFLLQAQRQNRRRVRLEQMLLLLLRCLAVLLIALMVMRPFVRPGALAAILGAAPRTERIILLDDSFSMNAQSDSGGNTAFRKACDAILSLARWTAAESPRDSLTVMRTSAPRDPAFSIAGVDDVRIEDLRQALDAVRPSQRRPDVADAVSAVAETIARNPVQANTAVYVVSDFQRIDWMRAIAPEADAVRKPRSLLSPLTTLSQNGHAIKLVLMNVGSASTANAAITGISSLRPQTVAGVPSRVEAAISNYTPAPLDQVEMGISIANHRLPPVLIKRIEPGQTLREPFEITFPSEGANYIKVELMGANRAGDSVTLDNTRSAAVDVAPVIQILIVDGESSNDPYRDEIYLLKTALRPEGRASSGNEVTVIEEQDLETAELSPYHVVILANVGRIGQGGLRNLASYVNSGGGLITFAGDQIDIEHYNTELFRSGTGLLPAALGDIRESPPGVDSLAIGSWDVNHPVMHAFAGPLAELIRRVKVQAFVSVDLSQPTSAPSMAPSMTSSSPSKDEFASNLEPAAGDNSIARVIARFNDVDESPAIIQRRIGRGTSVFVATTADQEWNDWASNFSYLPMMLELVQFCAKSSITTVQTTAGQPLHLEIEPAHADANVVVRTPSFPAEPELRVRPVPAASGLMRLEHNDTDECGIYEFRVATESAVSDIHFAAVNPDPVESDFAAAGKPELESSFPDDIPFEYVSDPSDIAERAGLARQEYWWPLLMGAVFVLMAEQVCAWWFGTRG